MHEAIAVFVPELPHFLESSVSHKNRNPSIKREFPESLPIPGALLRNLKRKKKPSRIRHNRLRLARFLEKGDTNIQTGSTKEILEGHHGKPSVTLLRAAPLPDPGNTPCREMTVCNNNDMTMSWTLTRAPTSTRTSLRRTSLQRTSPRKSKPWRTKDHIDQKFD